MHCKNCGAQYRSRELSCPYCGTENLLGRLWMTQITDAEAEYELTRQEEGKGLPIYVMNRVINRVLLISGGLIVLVFLALIGTSFTMEVIVPHFSERTQKLTKGDDIEAAAAQLYEDGEYYKLYEFMRDHELIGESGYEVYSQAAELSWEYEQFCAARMGFLCESEEKKLEDSYYLESSIRDGARILNDEWDICEEIEPENEELIANIYADVESWLRGGLKFTDQEMQKIYECKESYFSYALAEELADTAKEKGGWR